MSPPLSPQALYRPAPQALLDTNPDLLPADIELDGDGSEIDDALLPPSDPPAVVVDPFVRWVHFTLGCSVLLPWNVMITATPYFVSRLAESPLKLAFSSYLSSSFTASNFVFLAHATMTSKQSSPSRQTRITMFWLTVLTFLLTISTFFHLNPGFFFAFVIMNSITQAMLGSYLQTSIIAVASLFGPAAVQAMMSGQAAVAVAVSGVQVMSATISLWNRSEKAIAEDISDGVAETRSAFAFFTLSTVFLVASAMLHRWLVSMPVYTVVTASLEQRSKSINQDGSEERQQLIHKRHSVQVTEEKSRILRIAKTNVVYEVSVAYVFMITLAVFPPITTSIHPVNPRIHPLLFSAVHFLVFNVGDFLGRYICSFPALLIWSAKRLLALSLARTLFVPLFLMCNVQRPSSVIPYTPIINSDFLFMFILFAFGLSNGYLSSMCMMSAPSLDHNPRLKGRREDVDVAATVASFCLVGGLVLGSIASFAVRASICGCNPFTE